MIESIILDVDNVIADSIGSWCALTRHLGVGIDFNRIKNHKLVGCVDMPPAKVLELQDHVWSNWRKLKSTEPAIGRTIGNVRKMGIEVTIATSGPSRRIALVKDWLAFRGISYDRFCSVNRKSEIDCDALVDDAPEEVAAFAASGRTAFLYVRPWNRTLKDSAITRIQNLHALQRVLEKDRRDETDKADVPRHVIEAFVSHLR